MSYHEILIGATEHEIVQLEITIPEPPFSENWGRRDFSMCGTTFDRRFFTAEDGEERAYEYLEDGELWRMSVEDGRTEQSLEDFNDMVLDMDGWESVLGDVHAVDWEDNLYTQVLSGGQIDMHLKPGHIVQYADGITPQDVKYLFWVWKRYHLKDIAGMPATTLNKVRDIISRAETATPEGMKALGIVP